MSELNPQPLDQAMVEIATLRAENERLGTALDSAGQYIGKLEKAEARAEAAEKLLIKADAMADEYGNEYEAYCGEPSPTVTTYRAARAAEEVE
jgi:hypothetical protein